MTRKVFLPGFASNEQYTKLVTDELSEFFDEDVVGLAFGISARDPLRVDKLVKDASVITHSAGMTTLRGGRPREIIATAPPIPVAKRKLIGRAGLKAGLSTINSLGSSERAQRISTLDSHARTELLRNFGAHISQLGVISRFNALQAGVDASKSDIDVVLAFMHKDIFGFVPEADAVERAYRDGVDDKLHIVTEIEGDHDEMLLYPIEMIQKINQSRHA